MNYEECYEPEEKEEQDSASNHWFIFFITGLALFAIYALFHPETAEEKLESEAIMKCKLQHHLPSDSDDEACGKSAQDEFH